MKNKIPMIVMILSVIIVAGVVAYIFLGNSERRDFREGGFAGQQFRNLSDFSLDENTIDEITVFFESASDLEEIRVYCEENRINCGYYCRETNPEHEICDELTLPSGRSGGNFRDGQGGRR